MLTQLYLVRQSGDKLSSKLHLFFESTLIMNGHCTMILENSSLLLVVLNERICLEVFSQNNKIKTKVKIMQ